MAELGFPELISLLDAVIGLLVVTLPQPQNPRSLRDQVTLSTQRAWGQPIFRALRRL